MYRLKIYIYSLIALVCVVVVIAVLLDAPTVNNILATVKNTVRDSNGSGKVNATSDKLIQKIEASDFSGKAGKYSYVLSLDANEKKKFLEDLLNALKTYGKKGNGIQPNDFFNDVEALSVILAQLTLDENEVVSGLALSIINMLAWVPHSTSDLPDISKSPEIKAVLEQLVIDSDTDDDFRGVVIDAYSLLYPPNAAMINEFEKLIIARDINDGDTLNAIFGAFEKYKRLYNYDMPSSTLEVAKKLVDHPSESVKIDAFSVLSESAGIAVLPVLFNELETTRSLGVVNSLIMKILSLDQSDETVRRLKEIAAKTPEETGKVRFIETYTNPKNIERLRSKK